jgi:hypothetical protein
MAIQPEHRSILVVDIEEFSRRERTNPIQLDLHRDLRGLLQDALQAGEINQDVCEWEDRGDGFLITIGAEVPKSRLLDPVIPLLAERVEAHNRTAEPAWRLRLRVVVHAGEVLRDPKANVGQAVVAACRLLDSPELHAHLKATSRPLVVAVSDWIYQEIVQHGYGSIDRATYRRMPFTSKTLSTTRGCIYPTTLPLLRPPLARADAHPARRTSRHDPTSTRRNRLTLMRRRKPRSRRTSQATSRASPAGQRN